MNAGDDDMGRLKLKFSKSHVPQGLIKKMRDEFRELKQGRMSVWNTQVLTLSRLSHTDGRKAHQANENRKNDELRDPTDVCLSFPVDSVGPQRREINHIATGTAPSLDGELLPPHGSSSVMKMAVEMAAVSMEKPSGALPSHRCRNRLVSDLGFAMTAARTFLSWLPP
ncbi:hypothetical protein QYE76_015551 [Lolium multiflorum]|uniref:Uncharacterized protein n=1 Tax=Lolium multiflorum TaxID=4521 RepID=A0AAD8X9Y7_LOLMU|nr:hypothetical protein QYE76_015551 [Lolium multiflorum]